jgi:hypothetical protein
MGVWETARTAPPGRLLTVGRLRSGPSVAEVAAAKGVTAETVRERRGRYAAEGEPGLRDRAVAAATGRGGVQRDHVRRNAIAAAASASA